MIFFWWISLKGDGMEMLYEQQILYKDEQLYLLYR